MTIRIEGSKELQAALSKMSADVEKEVSKAVDATGLELMGDIKKRYARGTKTGRTYQKYSPRRSHTASAPGEAPAVDTGRLMNSVVFDKVGRLSAEVFTLVKYGFYLEFGTRKIRPRPAWVPAVEDMRAKFMGRLKRAVGGAIK